MSIAFAEPTNFHWWQLTTGTMDSCANATSYAYTGDLFVNDMGANSISLQGQTLLTLPRGDSSPSSINYYFYTLEGLTAADLVENSFFDLNAMTGLAEGLTVSQFARASKKVVPSSPNISSTNPPSISAAQTFIWSPSGASWISLRLYQLDTAGNITSDVNCNVEDDGQFTISNVHSTWLAGDVIYVQFTRVFENESFMSHNNSLSRVVGQHIIIGAGIMN